MENIIKIFTYINRFLMITMFILFLTIYLGFCMEFVLGLFHMGSSLVLALLWEKLDETARRHLLKYWTLLFLYIFSYLIIIHFELLEDNQVSILFGVVVIPMSLALYYSFILENLKKRML
ncbi:hypothetical protein SAMN04489761_3748 [Tenacibaculum sp. MAR_2009_124]|uniref:hypothetical protein n=1 Tax=Tenacibaculum sp. MAR_2009_124 TaxID=1250059 RepID=UPI000895AFF3|nr:hypothetical protein [Tenacibaculum sp. MAR_2009_124]SEC84396.1 hypothetical protein SAMN04489761_3748 [Tenacibaculum sp. MAR_2009_124]